MSNWITLLPTNQPTGDEARVSLVTTLNQHIQKGSKNVKVPEDSCWNWSSLARDARPQSEWLDQENGTQTKLKIPQQDFFSVFRSLCYSEAPLLIIMFTIQISITWDNFQHILERKPSTWTQLITWCPGIPASPEKKSIQFCGHALCMPHTKTAMIWKITDFSQCIIKPSNVNQLYFNQELSKWLWKYHWYLDDKTPSKSH